MRLMDWLWETVWRLRVRRAMREELRQQRERATCRYCRGPAVWGRLCVDCALQ